LHKPKTVGIIGGLQTKTKQMSNHKYRFFHTFGICLGLVCLSFFSSITTIADSTNSTNFQLQGGVLNSNPVVNSSSFSIPCGGVVQGLGVSQSGGYSITPGLPCNLVTTLVSFKYIPEKRIPIPDENKDISVIQVSLRPLGSLTNGGPIYTTPLSLNLETDSNGDSTSSFSVTAPEGSYDFAIKTQTHLTLKLPQVALVPGTMNLDFSQGNVMFGKAGDVNLTTIGDDTINSLDLGTLLPLLGTGNYRSDLNQDTTINSLDIGIMINNLNQNGE
jgi:hypothetical protein